MDPILAAWLRESKFPALTNFSFGGANSPATFLDSIINAFAQNDARLHVEIPGALGNH